MESFCTKKFNFRITHRVPRFGLPFYYIWDDFAENYPKNLTTFKEKSKFNTEKLLKKQFLGLYTDFFRKDGETYNFEVIKATSLNEKDEQADYYADIEDYSRYLFQNNGDLDIRSELNKFKPLKKLITPDETITVYFTHFVDRVLLPFFKINSKYSGYVHDIEINKYLYFTENVEKIVTFLQSDKTFEEWTKQEPTQEPQPAPVVSEEPQPPNIEPLQWKGTAIQLTELTEALINCNMLNPELNKEQIYERIKQLFNFDFDHKEHKKTMRKRTKDLTPFIEILDTSVRNWITQKDGN